MFPFPDSSAQSFRSFLRAYSYWLPPSLLALALVLIYLNPFIGDWDGLDYTVYSVQGVPSSMALGRALFTLTNHALYKFAHTVFGLQPQYAYLLFKYLVVAQVPLAITACWILARDLTESIEAATVAAFLVALSPIVVIYGGQVMTEVPSLLVSTTALIVHLRGLQKRRVWLVLLGAALLGLGVNLRETVGLYSPWLLIAPFVAGWKLNRQSIAVVIASVIIFSCLALGIFGIWFASDVVYRANWHVWLESSRNEASRHPLSL